MEPSKANYLTSGYVRCKLPGKSLVFSALVDSGNLSKYDLISESLAKRLKIPMHPSPLELGTAGKGQKLSVLGQCESFNIYIEKCGEMFEISPTFHYFKTLLRLHTSNLKLKRPINSHQKKKKQQKNSCPLTPPPKA